MGKPDWRQLVRQFPHIGGTLQLQYYCVLLLAARGQLHYETNDFIYLASQSVSQMIPTFDAISHFLGREVKHFDFLCCLHASKPTLFSNVRDCAPLPPSPIHYLPRLRRRQYRLFGPAERRRYC